MLYFKTMETLIKKKDLNGKNDDVCCNICESGLNYAAVFIGFLHLSYMTVRLPQRLSGKESTYNTRDSMQDT